MKVQGSKFNPSTSLRAGVQSCDLKFIVLTAFFFLTFNFALLTFNLSEAKAQTLSLSIWPPLLEVTIQPGRAVTQVYKLTNNSDHELQIFPQIFPFAPDGEKGEIKIKLPKKSEKTNKNNEKYFSFESGEKFGEPFYLPVGKERELVLKISIPRINTEQDYYFTLLFSTAREPLGPDSLKGNNQTFSVTQIGTNILISTSKTEKPFVLAKIVEFSAPKIIDSFSPVFFTVRLENWGKTLWKPFGKIKVTGTLSQKDEIPLLEQNILANSSRKLTVEPLKPKLPLGLFKATLEFSPNDNKEFLRSQVIFWYIPYKAIGSLLLLVLVVVFVKKFLNKKKASKPEV